MEELEAIRPEIKNKIGLIFTNVPVFELKPDIEANKLQTAARTGMIAPIDVVIPPGPTGLDPSQISFFHALQISVKINKSQIEIVKDSKICIAGKKVGTAEATLLQKLNVKPFAFGMNVISCYDDGSILSRDVVSINSSELMKKFQSGIRNIAALSLQTGIPTEASTPYMVLNAFKNLVAIGMQTGIEFGAMKSLSSGPTQT